jgi:hypothetical protein
LRTNGRKDKEKKGKNGIEQESHKARKKGKTKEKQRQY